MLTIPSTSGPSRPVPPPREVQEALADENFVTLRRLMLAAEFDVDVSGGHPTRVAETALSIAGRMGLGGFTGAWLVHAAPLHDIGKLAIPDAILRKQGPLTAHEFEIVKLHTVAGAALLSNGSGTRLLGLAREIALSHHERFDGTGYPHGLAGGAIPISGRIVALADVFDALTHARPYKQAWTIDRAVAEIRAGRGTHFDPDVVDAFLHGIGELSLARPSLALAS